MAVSVSGAARMAEVRAMLDMLDPADTEAQLIDRIRRVKDVMAAMTAVQAEDAAELEARRHVDEAARGVPKTRRGNGLAAEIGLARGQSPARGTK
ncbi:MAG: HNH endonuclease, partial [Yaniella sp.]